MCYSWWGSHGVLVCHEGNFVVPLKVAPWWPTWQGSHAVALLCAPYYRVPSQYLCKSRRGVLPSSRAATSMVLRSYSAAGSGVYSENSNLAVYTWVIILTDGNIYNLTVCLNTLVSSHIWPYIFTIFFVQINPILQGDTRNKLQLPAVKTTMVKGPKVRCDTFFILCCKIS